MRWADIIDLVLIGILCGLALWGYVRGVIRPVVAMVAILLAGCMARLAHGVLSDRLSLFATPLMQHAVVFLLAFLLSALILLWLGRRLSKRLRREAVNHLDRAGGAALAVVQGCLLLTFVLTPLQVHPTAGAPFRRSLVLPAVQFVGQASLLVLPSAIKDPPQPPVINAKIEIAVDSAIDKNGTLTRTIRIRGPESLFRIVDDQSVPLTEAGRYSVTLIKEGPSSTVLECRSQLPAECSPSLWPFVTRWSVNEGTFGSSLDYHEDINLSALIDEAEVPFGPDRQADEPWDAALVREFDRAKKEILKRIELRSLRDAETRIAVRLDSPFPLNSVSGPGGSIRGQTANWKFKAPYGPALTIEALGSEGNWVFGALGCVAVATVLATVLLLWRPTLKRTRAERSPDYSRIWDADGQDTSRNHWT